METVITRISYTMIAIVIISTIISLVKTIRMNKTIKQQGWVHMEEVNMKTNEVRENRGNVTFNDIAGNEGIKEDLQVIIEYFKDPSKFSEMGARCPRGIILYGPPGTGKTMLVKALSGESNVSMITVSGSEFVEKYVGVGAKRVRDLFEKARKQAPCIIFIDELDAVGMGRIDSSNEESVRTVNSLLSELDGFEDREGVVVIGATNRLDMLDSALIRPGRFDKHISVNLPQYEERLEMLKIHSKNKPLGDCVNLESIAKTIIGFSGADIENLMNESALLAVVNNKKFISKTEMDIAMDVIISKGNRIKSTKEDKEILKIKAYHEAGHVLIAKKLTKRKVPKVTIISSTSGFGGYALVVPEKMGLETKEDLENTIRINYGGICGEKYLTNCDNKITTGATQDIKVSTNIIKKMIKEYGMTKEFGLINIYELENSDTQNIVELAKEMSKRLYDDAYKIIKTNGEILEELANALIEKEVLYEDEIDKIIEETKQKVKQA